MITLNELVEKHGESIDNLPTEDLLEAIYNERYAHSTRILQHTEHGTQEEEKSKS
jgi:hypothetical protein